MTIEHHDLHHEFPELGEKIHEMKIGNHHFARLFDEYHHLDREIRRIETGTEVTDDKHMEELKMKRVHLKDQLYHMLIKV